MGSGRTERKKAIEIRHLTKYYGKHRGIVDVSFSVDQGDIFGFLGPNGAGKSTAIRSMLGIIHCQSGEIYLLGRNVKDSRNEVLQKVGYMPSEAMFYPSMKVKEVIRFAAKARKQDCAEEAGRICELLHVDTEKKMEELSLGNRKKVSIVCAMQHRPELLILDEPTSGLDPLMQEAFFKLLLEYNQQGTTCFLSSHILSEIKQYCRNAVIIREGVLIRTDSVENLTKTGVRRVKIETPEGKQEFVYTGSVRELIHKLDGMELEDVLIEEPSIEEVFMHYYDEKKQADDFK